MTCVYLESRGAQGAVCRANSWEFIKIGEGHQVIDSECCVNSKRDPCRKEHTQRTCHSVGTGAGTLEAGLQSQPCPHSPAAT